MDFYSEFMEDIWLYVHGQLPEKGTYVDVGCYHPQIASNTAFLRDAGWSGVAIDANPKMAPLWEGFTFVNALVGDGTPTRYKVNEENPGWSKVGEGEEVTTRTLNSILEEHKIGKVDILSIDLEGCEYDVLRTFDYSKYQPTYIVAEYDTQGIGKDYRVLEYLVKGDYIAMHMTEANIIYRLAVKKHFKRTS